MHMDTTVTTRSSSSSYRTEGNTSERISSVHSEHAHGATRIGRASYVTSVSWGMNFSNRRGLEDGWHTTGRRSERVRTPWTMDDGCFLLSASSGPWNRVSWMNAVQSVTVAPSVTSENRYAAGRWVGRRPVGSATVGPGRLGVVDVRRGHSDTLNGIHPSTTPEPLAGSKSNPNEVKASGSTGASTGSSAQLRIRKQEALLASMALT